MSVFNKVKDFTALTEIEIEAIVKKVKEAPEGKIVCAGVWKGGDVMAIQITSPNREVVVIDSFCGLAPPSTEDETKDTMINGEFDIGGIENFEKNFKTIGLSPPKEYQMFIDKLSINKVYEENIALLWLDLDHYLPTKSCLEHFEKFLVPEAIVITHDYGFERCPGIKIACDEFRDGWEHLAGGIFILRNK